MDSNDKTLNEYLSELSLSEVVKLKYSIAFFHDKTLGKTVTKGTYCKINFIEMKTDKQGEIEAVITVHLLEPENLWYSWVSVYEIEKI